MILHFILLGLLVITLVLAVFLRDLLKAAIALALGSAALSVLFFWFNTPFAAVFELSVCAGLVMVLLVSTIGLTKRDVPEDEEKGKSPWVVLPVLMLLGVAAMDIVVFMFLSSRMPLVHNAVPAPNFPETLWRVRWLDVLGQLAVIVVGVFAILALFRKEGEPEDIEDNHQGTKAPSGIEEAEAGSRGLHGS